MHDPYLELYICIGNVSVEGTVSQIFDLGPGSFYIKFREKKKKKSYRFFSS